MFCVVSNSKSADGTVGYTPGTFSVNEMGSALYLIKIDVPPGSNLEPELSIAYDSKAGETILGPKWSLAGLSTISRAPSTYSQHGTWDPIDFDVIDRFSLDGQLLVCVVGVEGEDGSIYRTENESFVRVEAHGRQGSGPQSFTVNSSRSSNRVRHHVRFSSG